MTTTEVTMPRDLSSITSALELIETDLCNYLAGEDITECGKDPEETIRSLMDAAVTHLRRLRTELRAAGMSGTISYDAAARIVDLISEGEVDDDPLSLQIEEVLGTMQPLLALLTDTLVTDINGWPYDPETLNSRLLAIDHLAMMTLGRAEKCREIASA
jgi:hypothetical protein